MENDDPDAALVDSFFLPGGILDPDESYEEEEPLEPKNNEVIQIQQQPPIPVPFASPQIAISSSPLVFPPQAIAASSDARQLPFIIPTPTTTFNPKNPWAESFFRSETPFQITPPPGFVAASPPPGFEAVALIPQTSNNITAQTSHINEEDATEVPPADEAYTDDESIQSVPRELMQDENSSYADSYTSSLSNSSSSDDFEDSYETRNKDTHGAARIGSVELAVEPDAHQKEAEARDVATKEAEKQLLEDALECAQEHNPTTRTDNPSQAEPPALTPSSRKSLRIVGESEHPISPLGAIDNTLPAAPTSPTKSKPRKRRNNKKSKIGQALRPTEKVGAFFADPLELPSLAKKRSVSSSKAIGNPGKVTNTKLAHSTNESGKAPYGSIGVLWRCVRIVTSIAVEVYRAALNESMLDGSSLFSYAFFRYCPFSVATFIEELCLPHWTSHVFTLTGIWGICTPLPYRDRTVVPLRAIRLLALLRFLYEGLTREHASIMLIPSVFRMLVAFCIAVVRNGYWDSPLLWLSFIVQIFLALSLPYDPLLIVVGLASINCKRSLVMKTMKDDLKAD